MSVIQSVISGVVAASTFAGALSILFKFFKPFGRFVNSRIKYIAETERVLSELDTLCGKVDAICIIGESQEKQLDILEGVAKVCLFNSIQGLYFDVREKGAITDVQRRELIVMYEKYRRLGGDGYITQLKDIMLSMPTDI